MHVKFEFINKKTESHFNICIIWIQFWGIRIRDKRSSKWYHYKEPMENEECLELFILTGIYIKKISIKDITVPNWSKNREYTIKMP